MIVKILTEIPDELDCENCVYKDDYPRQIDYRNVEIGYKCVLFNQWLDERRLQVLPDCLRLRETKAMVSDYTEYVFEDIPKLKTTQEIIDLWNEFDKTVTRWEVSDKYERNDMIFEIGTYLRDKLHIQIDAQLGITRINNIANQARFFCTLESCLPYLDKYDYEYLYKYGMTIDYEKQYFIYLV